MENTALKSLNNEENISGFFGTENYYKVMFNHLLTDGTKFVAEKYGTYLFYDIICSYQIFRNIRLEEFQNWSINRISESKFEVIGTDGNSNVLAKSFVDSDLDFDTYSVYLCNKVIMLPSEY